MIRLGYSLGQWKPNFDDFTRTEQHVRACKVLVASGFRGIELRAGSGRWDPLGRPASIAATYGSVDAFLAMLHDVGIEAVTSWFFDPGAPIDEELSRGRSILDPDHHDPIAATCRELAAFLAAAGGDRIVVRALPSAWQVSPVSPESLAVAAAGWNRVGAAVAEHGAKVTLHADALSAACELDVLDALLAATDPTLVGLTIDTAELTIAGIDPVDAVRRFGGRIDHVHLQDTRHVARPEELRAPHAERAVLQEGGADGVERWFHECGTDGGLVDVVAVTDALAEHGYEGWCVFESDHSPNPASSVMLNGWFAQHRLGAPRTTPQT